MGQPRGRAPWALLVPAPCQDEGDPCDCAGPCDGVLSLQMLPVVETPMFGSVTTAGVFLAAGVATVLLTAWMALMSRTVVCSLCWGHRVWVAGGTGHGASAAVFPQCAEQRRCNVPAPTTASHTGSCAIGTRAVRMAGMRRGVPSSPVCLGSGSAGTGCASWLSGSATGLMTVAIHRMKTSAVSKPAGCSSVGQDLPRPCVRQGVLFLPGPQLPLGWWQASQEPVCALRGLPISLGPMASPVPTWYRSALLT